MFRLLEREKRSSPARRYHKAASAREVAQNGDLDLSQMREDQTLAYHLKTDKSILKNFSGVQDKVIAKAEMLPRYAAWVQGVLASGKVQADDQITPTFLLWQIDCGQLDEAMPLIRFAIENQLHTIDEFKRELPEVIVEEIAEQVSKGAAMQPENLAELAQYATAKQENGQHRWNMSDVVRAKMCKAVGEIAEEEGDFQAALNHFQAALNYNERIGVKKNIAALEKQLAATT